MKYERFEDLPVWNACMELACRDFDMTEGPHFVGRAGLRDQFDRATLSVTNNIAEGFERGTTQELITFLYYARGSAGEVRSMLNLLERRPAFQDLKSEISNLKFLAENIGRQLRGWADALQNSDIKGQRYLTDQTRRAAEQKRRGKQFDEHLRRLVEDRHTEPPPSDEGMEP